MVVDHAATPTCGKGQNDGHPADDVGPGEAPVQEAFPKEGDRHSGVNRQSQQSEKTWQHGSSLVGVTHSRFNDIIPCRVISCV